WQCVNKLQVARQVKRGQGDDEARKKRHYEQGEQHHVQQLDDQLVADPQRQLVELTKDAEEKQIIGGGERCAEQGNAGPADFFFARGVAEEI
ncbi:MAG: hypothetical protein JSU88_02045, partial [Nitrospinaceae bacterium]